MHLKTWAMGLFSAVMGSTYAQVLPHSVALKTPEIVALAKSNADSSEFVRDSGVLVLNFWATWCKPCVKELPYFKISDSLLKADGYGKKTQFMFFSLDFDSLAMEKSTALLSKKHIPGYWFWVDESDYDKMITGVDSAWQGDIPFTLVISKKKGTEPSYINFESSKDLYSVITEHH